MSELDPFITALKTRAQACELCGQSEDLAPLGVGPNVKDAHRCVLCCGQCRQKIQSETFDEKSWYALRDSMWSEVPAVVVLTARILHRIGGAFGTDLVEQMYLDEDTQAWIEAERFGGGFSDDAVVTKDSNGTVLADGDSVTLIKDLVVKGGGFTAKRGTMVRGIRLIGDPENIEGRVNKTMLVLKTQFLKKA